MLTLAGHTTCNAPRAVPLALTCLPLHFDASSTMPQSDAAMKQLLLSAPDPNALAVKFAELKAHKVKDLDKVVVLLAKLLTGACSLRRQWVCHSRAAALRRAPHVGHSASLACLVAWGTRV